MKVQLDPGGVVVSEDGYLVGAGAIHPSGAIYSYVENGGIAELPVAIYDLLVQLAAQGRVETRRRFETGEPIPEGHRDVALFWLAVELLRGGVVKQFKGAERFVAKKPTGPAERARGEARSALRSDRAGAGERPRGRGADRRLGGAGAAQHPR